MDMDTVIIDNLEVCTPDIDTDHTGVTFPFVSNRTLPVRWTLSGPWPLDAATSRSGNLFLHAGCDTDKACRYPGIDIDNIDLVCHNHIHTTVSLAAKDFNHFFCGTR